MSDRDLIRSGKRVKIGRMTIKAKANVIAAPSDAGDPLSLGDHPRIT